MSTPGFRFAAVILAAGASSRMGSPKLLLPWRGTTVLAHTIGLWRTLGATELALVVSANSDLTSQLPADVMRITNPRPELGMFESIRCAARWTGWHVDVTHFALILGDQPHLQHTMLQALLSFAAANPSDISQPSRNGRGRHPVIVPRPIFMSLQNSNAQHLKDFILSTGVTPARIEIDDPGLDLDIDTPEDYQRALLEHEKLTT